MKIAISRVIDQSELPFGDEACELLTRRAAIDKRHGTVVVRAFDPTHELAYMTLDPKAAMRLGARFIQAAIHADPELLTTFDETIASARRMEPQRR
jgi:hypothetical protein